MAHTTKIIPFDWEYYQSNKDKCRVITSDKEPKYVSELTKFETLDKYCLVGVIDNEIWAWLLNGGYSLSNQYAELNLQLEVTEEVVEGYANLYRHKVTGKYVISEVYETEHMATIYFEDDFEYENVAIIKLHEIKKQTNK